MTIDALLALCLFAFVTSITPGPSNLMLLASGASFGLWRTLPQVAGITLGFTALLLAVGLGLGAALAAWPALHIGLQAAGAAYLLYLAWRIGRSRSLGGDGEARPLTLWQSAAFQWVNPKAWAVAATTMAVHASPQAPVASVLLICAAFAVVNLPSILAWAGCGQALRRVLADPARLKWFNLAMAALLAATLWPMLV
ncbi:MAG: LysE family translocator [Inquilinus limosus]|uniref:LysE family translocator n=1 Tax=Inquilinus limosus TaxID=171674 RepID=A0A952FKJ8_9PROT|nr:LysE family translocator [Inquilinus limosus]